jgi:hypothetical protein
MNAMPPADDAVASRLRAIAGAPDLRDWDDVVRRAAPSARLTGRRRRRLGLVLTAAGLSCLAAVLVVFLVLAPTDRATAPSGIVTYRTAPPLAPTDIPPAIKAALHSLGASRFPPAVVELVEGATFSGRAFAYRGIGPDGRYATFVLDDHKRGLNIQRVQTSFGCLMGTATIPEDPRGAPRRVVVPDVTGLRPEEASRRLQAAGLEVRLLRPPHHLPGAVAQLSAIFPASGTSVFAGTTVAVPAVERLEPSAATSIGEKDIRPCAVGGDEAGRWIVGAAAPAVAGVRTEWAGGAAVDGVVRNGMYLLPLLPRDCDHSGPPTAIVATGAGGATLTRITSPDERFTKTVDTWALDPEQSCDHPDSTEVAGASFSVFDRPATPDDRLPAPLVDAPGETFGAPIDSSSVRIARRTGAVGRYGDVAVVAARPAGSHGACLVLAGDGVTGGGVCTTRADAALGGAVTRMQHSAQGDPVVIAGLLPDGYVEVRSGDRRSTVEGNAWLLTFQQADAIPKSVKAVRADGTVRTLSVPRF